MSDESIKSLPDAVAAPGALPVPVGPGPSGRERLRAAYVTALDNAARTHPCPVLGDRLWSGCVHYDEAGRVSGVGSCHSGRRADAVLAVRDAEVERLRELLREATAGAAVADDLTAEWRRRAESAEAQVAELEAQRERRRVRLVALQNDALSVRGSLSPNGEDRKVPFALGETLTPAVDWLIGRVAELEAAQSVVFLARRDSRVLGVYGQSEDALHHCEDALGREPGYDSFPFFWRERPDATRELFAWTSQEVESSTGFTVARLELRAEFDEGWGVDADEENGPAVVLPSERPVDTLPAWLHWRFGKHGQSWDSLGEDDRSYWERHAQAVRRAVERGGFKAGGFEVELALGAGPDERPVNGLTKAFVSVASLREPEPEFHAFLHHENRVSHDRPETGGAS